jgi:hypothetical protein
VPRAAPQQPITFYAASAPGNNWLEASRYVGRPPGASGEPLGSGRAPQGVSTWQPLPQTAFLDGAGAVLVKEMKAQGVWNNVAVQSVSEFGRTLTTNGV